MQECDILIQVIVEIIWNNYENIMEIMVEKSRKNDVKVGPKVISHCRNIRHIME